MHVLRCEVSALQVKSIDGFGGLPPISGPHDEMLFTEWTCCYRLVVGFYLSILWLLYRK